MKNHKTAYLQTGIITLIAINTISCNNDKNKKENTRPNILFAIADDISYPHMGAYGNEWTKTPAFDRVAKNGLLFENAYTPNAKCSPSRACIITGRNSWQLEEAANHWYYWPEKYMSVVEVLTLNGYATGFTGKGIAPIKFRGDYRELTGKPYQDIQTKSPTGGISNTDYAANFKKFMEERDTNKPFFFWYGGYEPHRAYTFNSSIEKGNKQVADVAQIPGFWPSTDTVRTDMLDYAFEIEYFDKHLDMMLKMLEKAGELENTLVIVTADNGMPFPRTKGQAYEYSNHMPLAMMWKKGIEDPGRKVNELISFIDFAPTFLELAGIEPSNTDMHSITGESLTDILSNKTTKSDNRPNYVLIGKERHDVGRPNDQGYPIRGIFTDTFLYIKNFKTGRWPAGNPETGYLNCDGSPTKSQILYMHRADTASSYWHQSFGKRRDEELYNIKKDPECLHNLAGKDDYKTIKEELNKTLTRKLKAQKDPRITGNGCIFEQYEYANKNDRNFYKRFMNGEDIPAGWVNESDFEKKDK